MKKNWRGFSEGNGYFDQLPNLTQTMIKRLITDAFEHEARHFETFGPEGSYRVEELECRSRDGFIPHSHNRGGIDVSGYTTLDFMNGSGYLPSNEKSREHVQAAIDSGLQSATEAFFEKHAEVLAKHGITTVAQVSYSDFNNSKIEELQDLAEELSEYEREYIGGDNSTVMVQYRVMYHGQGSEGIHSMTVFASINTEAPYHRGKYDDNVSEIEITWRKGSALKTKLVKALKDSAKAVF